MWSNRILDNKTCVCINGDTEISSSWLLDSQGTKNVSENFEFVTPLLYSRFCINEEIVYYESYFSHDYTYIFIDFAYEIEVKSPVPFLPTYKNCLDILTKDIINLMGF